MCMTKVFCNDAGREIYLLYLEMCWCFTELVHVLWDKTVISIDGLFQWKEPLLETAPTGQRGNGRSEAED